MSLTIAYSIKKGNVYATLTSSARDGDNDVIDINISI